MLRLHNQGIKYCTLSKLAIVLAWYLCGSYNIFVAHASLLGGKFFASALSRAAI